MSARLLDSFLVLVAEDDPDTLEIYEAWLPEVIAPIVGARTVQILSAPTITTVLKYLDDHARGRCSIDLCLLDGNLPFVPNRPPVPATSLVPYIKHLGIPAIAAPGDAGRAAEMFDAGCIAKCVKPFGAEELAVIL
ncbi:MAG: hypothetical protein Q8R07_03435 [Candidatus Uhrbacteria bacterium]|nr:hypothetical protein [Candidatus Uhrbacteria bacterium]